jgi:2-(3-amino-3-carboxypropyl)histidine synthase
VDGFLFIGGGDFHPLGVTMETGKKVIVADPYNDEVRSIDELTRRILRQRWIAIEKARKATKFGIIVGLKPGQRKIQSALKAKEKLKKAGKEIVLLAAGEIRSESMINFQDIEVFVITACPRLATDDHLRFTKPILNEKELAIMLREEKWEDYVKE